MSVSSPAPLPERFGRYEVRSLIGEGAMGRVYRGFDPLANRVVAIKTLKSEYLTSDTRDEYLRRFRREAQAAGGLSHPGIITVFDVGEDFFVMELLEGATLQALLWERGRLEPADALRILAPVADALDYAHRGGVIHRDIKPGNIMVLPDGRPKIMDFGVAHLASTVMTASGQFLGSPSYMAPEQIRQSQASPASDLFSLAVLAYEMFTGRRPFEGDSITTIIYKVVHEDPPPPRRWNGALPSRYDAVFERALAKDPARRYPSATALLAALEEREIEATLVGPAPAAPASEVLLPLPIEAVETFDLKPDQAPQPQPPPPEATAPSGGPQASRRWTTYALLGLLAALVVGVLAVRPRAPEPQPGPTPLRLRIETDPPGARVALDGAEAGLSPLTVEHVAPGTHTVHVAREDFAPAQLSLVLVAGMNLAPLRFVLLPTTARLRLVSEPAGGRVSIDGREAGQTPIEGAVLEPGPHDLRVELHGFRPWLRTVEARAGEALDLLAQLEKGAGRPGGPPPAGPRVGELVGLGPGVTPPKRISGEAPSYPEEARRLHLEGLVVVDMVVTETGEPRALRVVESAGEVLDETVLAAVKTWRFEPAVRNGVKVRVHWQTRQRFESR